MTQTQRSLLNGMMERHWQLLVGQTGKTRNRTINMDQNIVFSGGTPRAYSSSGMILRAMRMGKRCCCVKKWQVQLETLEEFC